MEPKPVQEPYPPIWFGGSHPNAIRRAAKYADGFFGAGSSTTAQFAEQVEILREELHGREDFQIAKRVYIAVDDDPARARQLVSDGLDRLYGFVGLAGRLAPVAVAGTPEDCVQGLREVAAAGAQMIMLNPLHDELGQMERLAAEVVPEFA
jgi:alkanesulfonate monooxygenase SsuD/methylene tetrahydromethanopterin reductase-like flavin-dependent oxidoreductase (luciferase family)